MKKRRQYLLDKFLHDQCSQEELQELLTYLEEDEENEYDDILRQVWEELQVYSMLDESAIARISERVSLRISSATKEAKVRPLAARYWFRYAATLTGLLMVVGALYFLLMSRPSLVAHKTAYGETMQVVLPDSSVVTLNGNSHISYTSAWKESAIREVWLEGEAFFEVRRKEKNEKITERHEQGNTSEKLKFVVHTPNFDVEVLGTSFNVNDRGERASVVLRTGKVRLQKHDALADIIMQPGELVAFSRESNGLVTKTVDPDLYTSWIENKLVFDRTPLAEIARLLEDNYGLEVTLRHKHLRERIFTGTIPTMQVDALLTILEESMQIDITKSGNRVMME